MSGDPSTEAWPEPHPMNSPAVVELVEQMKTGLEIEGVREELTRQAAANEDLRATLAVRSRALAASQADLTRVSEEAEQQRAHKEAYLLQRDRAWVDRDEALAELAAAEKELDKLREPCAWRDLAVTAMQERAYARAQLDDAIATFGAERGQL